MPHLLGRWPVLRACGDRQRPPLQLRLARRLGVGAEGDPQRQGRRLDVPHGLQLRGRLPPRDSGDRGYLPGQAGAHHRKDLASRSFRGLCERRVRRGGDRRRVEGATERHVRGSRVPDPDPNPGGIPGLRVHPSKVEIVVVDSGSTDNTRNIARGYGADVYKAADILPDLANFKGKGENLWKALYVTQGDIIVYLDADIKNIHHRYCQRRN